MTKEEEIKSVVGWSKKNLIPKEEHEKPRKKLVELSYKANNKTKANILAVNLQ